MLQSAIDEAIARGDRSMLLEVFAANHRLYERLGFRNERELFHFRHVPTQKSPPDNRRVLQEVDPMEVARLVMLEGEPNISWMYAPATLMGAAAPSRAFQLDEKAYVMLRQDAERTLLQTVLVRPEHRRQGRGRELLHAVEAAFPEKPLVISMLPSGSLYSFLQAMHWELMPLPLFEMIRPL